MAETERASTALVAAAESGDSDAIEDAMDLGFELGFDSDCVPALLSILKFETHTRHEDVVSVLQELRDPRAVDSLHEAAFMALPYLDYDEFFGLARKCTWALADIGTPEARAQLQHLSVSGNSLIASYAQKRLNHWTEELSRKGLRRPQG